MAADYSVALPGRLRRVRESYLIIAMTQYGWRQRVHGLLSWWPAAADSLAPCSRAAPGRAACMGSTENVRGGRLNSIRLVLVPLSCFAMIGTSSPGIAQKTSDPAMGQTSVSVPTRSVTACALAPVHGDKKRKCDGGKLQLWVGDGETYTVTLNVTNVGDCPITFSGSKIVVTIDPGETESITTKTSRFLVTCLKNEKDAKAQCEAKFDGTVTIP